MPTDNQTTTPCACCGDPATHEDAEGVPLCEGDYLHLVEHWREFEADHEVAKSVPPRLDHADPHQHPRGNY